MYLYGEVSNNLLYVQPNVTRRASDNSTWIRVPKISLNIVSSAIEVTAFVTVISDALDGIEFGGVASFVGARPCLVMVDRWPVKSVWTR